MLQPIELIIPVEPTAKARARVTSFNGHFISYTPAKTVSAENDIMKYLYPYKNLCYPAGVGIKLTIIFYRTKPKSIKKSELLPFRKPDTDNMTKLVLDACNEFLFPDDSQITTLHTSKRWSDNGHGSIFLRMEEDA